MVLPRAAKLGSAKSIANFLLWTRSDPRERAVVSLISAVEASGPILVWYASFEKGRLADLARAFPTYAIQLQAIADRIVDIHPLFASREAITIPE